MTFEEICELIDDIDSIALRHGGGIPNTAAAEVQRAIERALGGKQAEPRELSDAEIDVLGRVYYGTQAYGGNTDREFARLVLAAAKQPPKHMEV